MTTTSRNRAKVARLVNDADALPLLFNIDNDGYEYTGDLLDQAAAVTPCADHDDGRR